MYNIVGLQYGLYRPKFRSGLESLLTSHNLPRNQLAVSHVAQVLVNSWTRRLADCRLAEMFDAKFRVNNRFKCDI